MPARVALGATGIVLMAIAIVVLVNPTGFHTARGLSFLLLAGGALLVVAIRAR